MTRSLTTSSSRWCIDLSLWAAFSALGLPLCAQPRCAPVPAGLSAWFTFDEPQFRPLRVPGLVGSAARFNGKDQYFELPASTRGIDVGEDDFTIELWIRTADSLSTRNLVDKRDYSPLGYLIFIWKGHPGFQVPNGDRPSQTIALSVNIADRRWHHVAGVVRRLPPQPIWIYVDGVKQPEESTDKATLVSLDVATPLWLGRHHANRLMQTNDLYFEGEMDELSFYRRALTAAEILAIYRAGSAGKCR
jgi:hypothetical protein